MGIVASILCIPFNAGLGGEGRGGGGVMKGRADTAKSALKAERGGKGEGKARKIQLEKNGTQSSAYRIE